MKKQSQEKTFTGHAVLIDVLTECNPGEHYLLLSKQFDSINEVVISHERAADYPNIIYYSYAHREQGRTMALWLHELNSPIGYSLYKIQ